MCNFKKRGNFFSKTTQKRCFLNASLKNIHLNRRRAKSLHAYAKRLQTKFLEKLDLVNGKLLEEIMKFG